MGHDKYVLLLVVVVVLSFLVMEVGFIPGLSIGGEQASVLVHAHWGAVPGELRWEGVTE